MKKKQALILTTKYLKNILILHIEKKVHIHFRLFVSRSNLDVCTNDTRIQEIKKCMTTKNLKKKKLY